MKRFLACLRSLNDFVGEKRRVEILKAFGAVTNYPEIKMKVSVGNGFELKKSFQWVNYL